MHWGLGHSIFYTVWFNDYVTCRLTGYMLHVLSMGVLLLWNNNNNPICKVPECQKTSVALNAGVFARQGGQKAGCPVKICLFFFKVLCR